MLRTVAVLATLAAMCVFCDGARILAIFTGQTRSHIISFSALTRQLVARGHHLTVISSFPQQQSIPNYTDIVVPKLMDDRDVIELTKDLDMETLANLSSLSLLNYFLLMARKLCSLYLEEPGEKKLLTSDEDFDLIIMELIGSECLFGFLHKYSNATVMGVYAETAPHYITDMFGSPSPFSVVPSLYLNYGTHMTLPERLVNTLQALAVKLVREHFLVPFYNSLMHRYFATLPGLPHLTHLMKRFSFLLINSDLSYTYVRPYTPNVMEVGGMHIQPPKQLPESLQKFLDGAKDGAVYMSFGSVLDAKFMSATLKSTFIKALSGLKQRVVMKWDDLNSTMPDNIRAAKWLPQSDILAHKNVKAFITHGGALSVQEAVYWAVPVVGIPICCDQGHNLHNVRRLGCGVVLELNNVSVDSLQWALNTVLSQPSYLASARKQSAIFRDQPMTSLERAVFWTEYVIRHQGAAHLQSPSRDLAWFQYLLVDVAVVLALLVATSILGFYCLAVLLYKTPRVKEKEP